MDMLGNALRGLPVNKKEQPKPLNRYGYPQLAAFKSTKAPGQYSTGTGGQYSTGANIAGGLQGWFIEKTHIIERTIMVVAGVALTYPDNWADLIDFAGFILVLISQLIRRKRNMGLTAG